MSDRQENLFVRGNSKLGNHIWTWSIPAKDTICVGHTTECAARCYAKQGFFRMANVKARFEANYQASIAGDFAARATAEIRRQRISVLRIHVAGDFYNADYIAAWHRIASACPETRFFAFTRSWRLKRLVPALQCLSTLPNVQLWFSEDVETIRDARSPRWPRTGRAFMVGAPEQAALVPEDVDLVFRDDDKDVAKRLNGVLVCPVEQGIERKTKITCSTCQICFTNKRIKSEELVSVTQVA